MCVYSKVGSFIFRNYAEKGFLTFAKKTRTFDKIETKLNKKTREVCNINCDLLTR